MNIDVCRKIDELCEQVNKAIANENFPLATDLLKERLEQLKTLELSVNKNDSEQFSAFSQYLLQISKIDKQQISSLAEARKRLNAQAQQQNKKSKAVSAYTKVKIQK